MKPQVALIATYDTKGAEAEYIKERIKSYGCECLTIDVGVGEKPKEIPDVTLDQLLSYSGKTSAEVRLLPRGEAVSCASNAVEKYLLDLYSLGKIHAAVGIGGAGGTQIVSQALRALPFGFPKYVLSTLASGNTRWYMQETDVSIIPSITDVAGLNSISKTIFDRFAALSASQAKWYCDNFPVHEEELKDNSSFRIGQTMYGTTTKGVTEARIALENDGYQVIVFHASGSGGRSMEHFVRQGIIHGILDMTIAEIGAHLVGGLHDGGPNRMEAAIDMGIPLVVVPGAADTVVLPPMDNLPEKFKKGRILNFHNPTMTTMRTNVEENISIANFLVKKLSKATRPVKLLLPLGGLSSIDRPGAIFYYPEANEALFQTLKDGLKGTQVEIIEDKRHIYDTGFGKDAAYIMDNLVKHYREKNYI